VPHYERIVDIAAPSDVVWSVMTDVERWPDWTSTTKSARRLEQTPFAQGSRAELDLEGAGPTTWRVTAFEPGRFFAWENDLRGVHSRAGHLVERDDSGSRVTLTVEQTGLIATLMSLYLGRISRRNLEVEAHGLKRRCEEIAARS
jgi:uncharacterized membrane protein